jgi:hypothetical protein
MALLRQTLTGSVIDQGTPRIVTIVGEAGVGKSRLLYELQNWMELSESILLALPGSGGAAKRHIPYALVRNLLSFRFQILERTTARPWPAEAGRGDRRFPRRGGVETAHFIGHLAGI